uniref:Aladin n=1 Tax=Aceria tosichella TaxID=561515 RepID=A0A6G1SMW4_9ACAR
MTSIRPFATQNLQNYPQIHIDRGSVIKPCNADQNAADQFIHRNKSSWKKVFYDIWNEGIPFILRWVSNLKTPANSSVYYLYLTKALGYVAFLLLHIHRIYQLIYGYFFPYAFVPLDEVCDEFSRCANWSQAVIRAFAWHPNHDRCAVAICNDYIYVYQGSSRIKVLRHAQQRKITDMAWQPSSKEVLVVATQTNIIIWRINETHSGQLNFSKNSAYLTPGLQLVMRAKESPITTNGPMKQANISSQSQSDSITASHHINSNDFKLLDHVLTAPIISIEFDSTGQKLYACSPNSCRLAILNINQIFNSENSEPVNTDQKPIEYLIKYGQGVTKLLWSPEMNRLATATTSSLVRVFEPFKWSCNSWLIRADLVQDFVWSKPHGRILLIANKTEPILYALPFLDNPQAGDVGGNKSLMQALDLNATRSDTGDIVGGVIQTLAWDKNGKRLAISFKENPESILLYRTVERPTVEFHQLGLIQNENRSLPLLMNFHDNFKNGSLLTVCWSDGTCQHIPMFYMPEERAPTGPPTGPPGNNSFNRTMSPSNSNRDPTSPSRTLRSLTNFCHVSGNNSISSYPINRIQHHTTLFSLSARSMLEETTDVSDLTEN